MEAQMPKLSDTALVILANAAKRKSNLVLPLPKSLKGGAKAAAPVLKALLKRKFISEQPASGSAPIWREGGDERFTIVITNAGLAAIGAADEPSAEKQPAKKAGSKPKAAQKRKAGTTPYKAGGEGKGTKIDLLKGMLASKEGMTVAEASKATGWLMHSVRGVMSGVLKKKLNLEIVSEKVGGRGRVYRLKR
jgi:Protein of unknown function (DUF3489)